MSARLASDQRLRSTAIEGQTSGHMNKGEVSWPINEVKLRSLLRRRIPTDVIARQYGVTVTQVNQLCEEYGTCRETTE